MQHSTHEMFEIYNPNMHKSQTWRFVSDQVMGGVSQGQVNVVTDQNSTFHCLSGQVSLENNGGFLQMQLVNLDKLAINFSDYLGLYIEVKGNSHNYNLHIRTSQLWLPWQSFRSEFYASNEWQRIFLPFDKFKSYKTLSKLNPKKINRLGILAIGEVFQADICIRNFGVYR
ncbi:CIA30 family protein [Thiomicrorhabdus sp. Milos-T2]|uniref:CIA30 family protein n=1 Tax=Thiomicrorhabdus sp. Milos-T2 TaxID=90814 RepID=UPI0006915B69|nr:CIA30 family protein [Thiomicrorhabdus sp. Milos-T2]